MYACESDLGCIKDSKAIDLELLSAKMSFGEFISIQGQDSIAVKPIHSIVQRWNVGCHLYYHDCSISVL